MLIDGVPLDELERRMRPGGWSREGFIQPGQSLTEVLAADRALLARLDVTSMEIADALQGVLEQGVHSDRFAAAEVGDLRVRIIRTRRMRTCPWAPQQFERCHVGRGTEYLTTDEFTIVNTRLGGSLAGFSLCIHLVRDHEFFGGPGTQYRIDPLWAVHVLGIAPSGTSE